LKIVVDAIRNSGFGKHQPFESLLSVAAFHRELPPRGLLSWCFELFELIRGWHCCVCTRVEPGMNSVIVVWRSC